MAQQNYAGGGRLISLIGQAAWFILLVFLICVFLCASIPFFFQVLSAGFGLSSWTSAVSPIKWWSWFLFWIVPAPALIWSVMLAIFSWNDKKLTALQHALCAFFAAFVGFPVTWFTRLYGYSFMRSNVDPRFDALGYFAILLIVGALSVVLVFPLLSIYLRALALYLKIPKLFLIEPDQLRAS